MTHEQVIKVTCALIIGSGKVLLAQRADSGLWELPGGKVEPGEDLASCLAREIKEELGAAIEVLRPVYLVKHRGQIPHLDLHCFLCRLRDGEPRALEHMRLEWVEPPEALRRSLSPPDRTLFQGLGHMDFFKHLGA